MMKLNVYYQITIITVVRTCLLACVRRAVKSFVRWHNANARQNMLSCIVHIGNAICIDLQSIFVVCAANFRHQFRPINKSSYVSPCLRGAFGRCTIGRGIGYLDQITTYSIISCVSVCVLCDLGMNTSRSSRSSISKANCVVC